MKYFKLTLLILLAQYSVLAQIQLSVESGLVSTQYNEVRVPNGDINSGTLFSLNDNFSQKHPSPFFRAELLYRLANKHTFEITAVPLSIDYQNANLETFDFAGVTFSGDNINGRYEFNTYRASYRYRILAKNKVSLDIGASLLVRDARIAITQGTTEVDDTDLGYVPLVSFEFMYHPSNNFSVLVKGDALVGPVGRAEDIFVGILYPFTEHFSAKAGYRVIEGGADVDQVYNFAFIHFANFGLVYTL